MSYLHHGWPRFAPPALEARLPLPSRAAESLPDVEHEQRAVGAAHSQELSAVQAPAHVGRRAGKRGLRLRPQRAAQGVQRHEAGQWPRRVAPALSGGEEVGVDGVPRQGTDGAVRAVGRVEAPQGEQRAFFSAYRVGGVVPVLRGAEATRDSWVRRGGGHMR